MGGYFFCYSTTLYHFLKANQQRYIVAGLHERTHNKFWLFEKTPELNRLLDEYDERKESAHARRL
ncbi:hypothetical protein ACNA6I_01405 [Rossellomorea sp. FS2]|uniref:hypothetical protein n=1 Tax=Rossellomorea sp. FS2 TaxID=3391447 RepID=UPI003A4E6710